MRSLTRYAAAALLAAAAYAGVPAAPASAAPCGTAEGVTVVVDFHELGGGVQSGCVRDGGDRFATDLFPAAGFPLAYVQRQPDFVCRVRGLPTPEQDPCVSTPAATAYWSLWWSDGSAGDWRYSTSNAGGLRVPDGGAVAFSWNTGSRPVPPGLAPVVHAAPEPTPSKAPTKTPSKAPSKAPGATATPTLSAAVTPRPSASPTATRKPKPTPSASVSATPTETTEETAAPEAAETVAPTSAEPVQDDEGLPAWAAPAVIAVLFAGAGAAALLRRRRTSSGS